MWCSCAVDDGHIVAALIRNVNLVRGLINCQRQRRASRSTVAVAPVASSITVTLLLPEFATYTVPVLGLTATARGAIPTGIVVAALVAPLIAVTVLLPWFATKALPLMGSTATANGFVPAGIVVVAFVEPSITVISLLPSLVTYALLEMGSTAAPDGSLPVVTVETQ